jgi:type VI secretion system protein ImpH
MADDARHARPDLTALTDEAPSLDFFELLRRLETPGRRFGRGGGAAGEPARLGQGVRLSFATQDVAEIRPPEAPSGVPGVSVNVMGLLGPEGPMPLHLTRWVMQRLSNRWFAGESERATSDTAFLDFANTLQHRQIALYWRAWADHRPHVLAEHPGGQLAAILRALAGVGMPGADKGPSTRTESKVGHATSLAQLVHGPRRLAGYLATVTGTEVEIREFVGVWTELPRHLQSRLGTESARLGRTAVAGARVFERQSRAEIRLGPLSLDQFLEILDEPQRADDIRHALTFAMGHGTEFDLRLVLRGAEVPEPRLGAVRLGRTGWLRARPGTDADDLALRRFTAAGAMAA